MIRRAIQTAYSPAPFWADHLNVGDQDESVWIKVRDRCALRLLDGFFWSLGRLGYNIFSWLLIGCFRFRRLSFRSRFDCSWFSPEDPV
jgi:hypothetical protein